MEEGFLGGWWVAPGVLSENIFTVVPKQDRSRMDDPQIDVCNGTRTSSSTSQDDKNCSAPQTRIVDRSSHILRNTSQEYNATKEKMDVDVEYFKNLQADCDTRSKFYNQQVLDANAEVSAIEAALPILQSIVDGTQPPAPKTGGAFMFLQVSAKTSMGARVDKVSRCIAKLGRSRKDAVLALLNTAEGLSAVENLVKTCETMIVDLQAGIKEVEQNKATCQSETARLRNALQVGGEKRLGMRGGGGGRGLGTVR